MKLRALAPVLVTAAFAGSVAAQSFINLPPDSSVIDITPDGTTVVGSIGGDGFVWRWLEDPAPTLIPGGYIVAVSDDGRVFAGNIFDPAENAQVAARWTEAGGWQSIGFLPSALSCPSKSSAYDISADGSTIVGLSWNGCDGRGFRWSQGSGMLALETLGNGHNRCSAISDDGTTMGGFAQGNFNRSPAYWGPGTSGAVLDMNFEGEVYEFSENGDLSVGTLYQGSALGNYEAYLRDNVGGSIINLGNLNSGWAGAGTDISEDPLVISGFDYQGLSREAWVWNQDDGIVDLKDFLTGSGISGVPDLYVSTAISDDGNVVVGTGANPAGGFLQVGFIATLGDLPWSYLGNALAGTQGEPRLTGKGPLLGGSVTTLRLEDAKPFGSAYLVLGVTPLNANFKGGVLVPSVDVLLAGLPVNADGELEFSFLWGLGFPSGASVWWQYWIPDAAGPLGWSASNGLQATAP